MSKYRIKIDGKSYELEIERMDTVREADKTVHMVSEQGGQASVTKPSASVATSHVPTNSSNSVVSPMPGTVNKVFGSLGDTVKAGEAVLILEAMKMENEITSPKDGKIIVLNASEGQSVQGGTLLFEIGE